MTHESEAGRAADKYEPLIARFIRREIAAPEFKALYLSQFKTDQDDLPIADFDILEELFTDTDDYVADPEARAYFRSKDPEFRKYVRAYDEEELRDRAIEAYRKLYQR